MNIMKKFRIGLLMMFMIMFTTTGFCGEADKGAEIKDARGYLEDVYADAMKFQSMHVDVAVDLKTALGNISSSSKIDLINTPVLLGKIDTNIVMHGFQGKSTQIAINQYINQVDDKLVSYTKFDDKWEKNTVPYKAEQYLVNSKESMNYIKSVKIQDQSAENIALEVSIDMVQVRRSVAEGLKVAINNTNNPKGMDTKQFIKVLDEVLEAMGNVTYTVTVNKAKKQIVNVHADWSKPAQNAAKIIVKQMPLTIEEQSLCQNFATNINLIIQEDISQYNNVKDFTIPEDVVRNAQEAKKDKAESMIPKEIESVI